MCVCVFQALGGLSSPLSVFLTSLQVLEEEKDSQNLSLEHNESGISSSASSDFGLDTSKEFESRRVIA